MGEYAIRESDGADVKVGTFDSMYYIRYEDRNKVRHRKGNVDCANDTGLRWRIPFPDEDRVKIGEYEQHDRAYPLPGFAMEFSGESGNTYGEYNSIWIEGKEYTEGGDIKHVQWRKRPEVWFGLSSVKNMPDGTVWAVVRCLVCDVAWRVPMGEVLPFVKDDVLRERLIAYNAKPEPAKQVAQTPVRTVQPPADKPKQKRKGSMDWLEMFG